MKMPYQIAFTSFAVSAFGFQILIGQEASQFSQASQSSESKFSESESEFSKLQVPQFLQLDASKPKKRNVASEIQVPFRHPKTRPVPRYRRYSKDETLSYDATFKEIYPKPDAEKAVLFFDVKNESEAPVTITQIRPSCGCTLAKSPNLPWKMHPGEGDRIELSTIIKGKKGTLTKSVSIFSSAGRKFLTFKIHLPIHSPDVAKKSRGNRSKIVMNDAERLRNMKIAARDRQAIFKGKCRSCHYDPALNQRGEGLFVAACGICHETPNRATMVPDLAIAKAGIKRSQAYWNLWITHGKAGTLMPAFHKKSGGPLTSKQIKDLSFYLTKRFSDEVQTSSEKVSVPNDSAEGLR